MKNYLISAILLNLFQPVLALDTANTDWLKNAGYGIGVHWTSQSKSKNGNDPIAYCNAVKNFDVPKFVNQLSDSGAGYVLFTISHAQWYFAFPNSTLDSLIGSRTCSRDLYMELADALAPKNIKMMFYFPSNGDNSDPDWKNLSGWNTNKSLFADNMYLLVESIGLRYGDKLAGWWVDNLFNGMHNNYDLNIYSNKLRAGYSNRIITYNIGGTDYWGSSITAGKADYQAGESQNITRVPTGRFSGEGGAQWHTWAPFDESNWVHVNNSIPTPRYSENKSILYTKTVMNEQGAMTWNIAPLQDTMISEPSLSHLVKMKAQIRNSGVSTVIDDRHGAIKYSSGWINNDFGGAHLNTTKYSTTANSFAKILFYGTDINWYGVKGNDHGKVDVYIDNVFDSTIDLNSSTRMDVEKIYSKTGLTLGLHEFKIVIRSDTSSYGRYVEIDSLEFSSKVDNSAFRLDGQWLTVNDASAYGGNSLKTNISGSNAKYTFKGTGVDLFGEKNSENGRADVYIDGKFVQTIDYYSPVSSKKSIVFKATGLNDGLHHIKIVSRGDKNPASTGLSINFDYLQHASSSKDTPKNYINNSDTNQGLSFVGQWSVANAVANYDGSTFYTNFNEQQSQSYFQYTFSGTKASIYGVKGPDHGKAKIFIDGVFHSEIDAFDFSRENQSVIFNIDNLTNSNHIITMYPGGKNTNSTNYFMEVDFVAAD